MLAALAPGEAFAAMLDAAKQGQVAEVDDLYPRPGSTVPMLKASFVTRVRDQVCGVGAYNVNVTRTGAAGAEGDQSAAAAQVAPERVNRAGCRMHAHAQRTQHRANLAPSSQKMRLGQLMNATSPVLADRRILAGGDYLSPAELATLTPLELTRRTTALVPLVAAHAAEAERLRPPPAPGWAAPRRAEGAGSNVHMLNQLFQRAMRDVNIIASQIGFDVDVAYELHGRALLGLPPNSAFT